MRSIESRIAAHRRLSTPPEPEVDEVTAGLRAWCRAHNLNDDGTPRTDALPGPRVPFWKHPNARDI